MLPKKPERAGEWLEVSKTPLWYTSGWNTKNKKKVLVKKIILSKDK